MAVSQITPTLFLSGADAPQNAALMSQKGITLIVNATLSHTSPAHPGVECVRVPVSDLPSARLGDHFDRVADRIHGNRPGGTLVHCAVGMSRSPALVMAYLMRYRGVTLSQAHRWVRGVRPFVRLNAGFWEQLLQYERRLYGRNTVRVEPPPQETPPPTTRTNHNTRITTTPRSPAVTLRSPTQETPPTPTRTNHNTRITTTQRSPAMTPRSPAMTLRSPAMTPRSPALTPRTAMTSPPQGMTSASRRRRTRRV